MSCAAERPQGLVFGFESPVFPRPGAARRGEGRRRGVGVVTLNAKRRMVVPGGVSHDGTTVGQKVRSKGRVVWGRDGPSVP